MEVRILAKLTLIVRKMDKQTVAALNFTFAEQAQTIVQKVGNMAYTLGYYAVLINIIARLKESILSKVIILSMFRLHVSGCRICRRGFIKGSRRRRRNNSV